MLMVGVTGFTVMSLLCALSVSPEMLVASRVLQGAFGAMLLPQGFGLIRDLFPAAEMGKAFAIFGPLMGFGAVLGPIVGGTLLDANVFGTGWRMLFLVNLPVGVAALALAARHLPSIAPSAPGARLDVPAVLYAGTGLLLLIFPLVQGHELGWPAWTFALLAGSIPAFALFARRQATTVRAGRSPLVLPSLFRNRAYLAGIGFAIAFFAAMGAMFTVGMLLQIGLGFTAMQASLTMSPWAVGAMVGSAFSGMLVARLGRTLLHVGVALMGVGVAGLAIAYVLAGAGLGFAALAVPLLVGGAGMGMVFVPMFDIILAGVGGAEIGSATGVLGAMEQLGITLGIAILGTVFFGIIGHQPSAGLALHAGVITALVTIAMLLVTFVVGFALPRKARA
jgi:MFS family permease